MKREGSCLYFEPEESEKFFRAIRLVERFMGEDVDKIEDREQHERAHVDIVKELGREDKIGGYKIKARKRRGSTYAVILRDIQELSQEELKGIALAPKNPSYIDFCTATNPIFMLKEILSSKYDPVKLKNNLLNEK